MMESHSPLTSPDGSSKRNPPERCPRPLYSRDPTQEHEEILQEDQVDGSSNRNPPERCPSPLYSLDSIRQRHKILRCYQYKRLRHIKTEVKEEADEKYQRDTSCQEEEIPPEISTDPGDTRDPQRDVKTEEEEECVNIKGETPLEINTDLGNSRLTYTGVKSEEKEEGHMKVKEEEIPSEISTDPGDTRDPQRDVKAEEEDRQKRTKRKILEIGMDGRYRWYNMEDHPNAPLQGDIVDDDITAYVLEEKAITPNLKPPSYQVGELFACPECGKCFSRKYDRIIHRRIHTGQKSFSCPECGKSFPFKSNLEQHQKTHTAQSNPFSCSECGMRFRTSRILATHKRAHTAKTVYKCSQCGQAFIKKLYLKRHERVHIGLKPY